jgi:hypothetical protein
MPNIKKQQDEVFGPHYDPNQFVPPPQTPMFTGMSPTQQVQGMQVSDTPDPALLNQALNPEEAQRQLRMENARRSYMMRFGMGPMVNGERVGPTQSQSDIDTLLQRVQMARQYGWNPRRMG